MTFTQFQAECIPVCDAYAKRPIVTDANNDINASGKQKKTHF